MDLPPAAAAMYPTWWAMVNGIANETGPGGGYLYNIAQAQAIAAQVYPDYEGTAAPYNPIGLSQLFSIARKMGNTAVAIANAPPDSPITSGMVAEAPWSRPLAEQAASPKWWARAQISYTTAEGVQETGTAMIEISQVLPYSVAALQTYVEIQAQSQLMQPPGTGTPRSGQLDSVDSIQLLAW